MTSYLYPATSVYTRHMLVVDIFGILTFMSRKNSILGLTESEN